MAKKTLIDTSDFDEKAMMHEISQYGEAMAEGNYKIPSRVDDLVPEDSLQEVEKDEPRRKRSRSSLSYEERFLILAEKNSRIGTSVTIRKDYYQRLAKMLAVIQGDKTTIARYVDNILNQHFEMYEEEANKLYAKLTGGGKLY